MIDSIIAILGKMVIALCKYTYFRLMADKYIFHV